MVTRQVGGVTVKSWVSREEEHGLEMAIRSKDRDPHPSPRAAVRWSQLPELAPRALLTSKVNEAGHVTVLSLEKLAEAPHQGSPAPRAAGPAQHQEWETAQFPLERCRGSRDLRETWVFVRARMYFL